MQTFVVQGKSMEPNFFNRDYLLVDKISYRFSEPHRGQIVVFRNPENRRVDFVKRIIGLPKEKVTIREGTITIDDSQLKEPYLSSTVAESEAEPLEVTLADQEYFMLGDNRENSLDSRRIGAIGKHDIVGRVFVRVLPLDRFELAREPSY